MKTLNCVVWIVVLAFVTATAVNAQTPTKAASGYDADLAAKTGADEYGMRSYVLVLLKSGPKRMPDGKDRDAMFAAHLANINRLAGEGKMVLAGPLDGVGGVRGLFVLAVADIDEAKKLVATDPTIIFGELVAEYHKWYGSAAVTQVNAIHSKIAKKEF